MEFRKCAEKKRRNKNVFLYQPETSLVAFQEYIFHNVKGLEVPNITEAFWPKLYFKMSDLWNFLQ